MSDLYRQGDLVAKVTVLGNDPVLQSLPRHVPLEASVPSNESVVYVEDKKISLGYNSASWMYSALSEVAITKKLQSSLRRPEFRGYTFVLDDQHNLCAVLFLSYIPGKPFVEFVNPDWSYSGYCSKSYLQTVGEVVTRVASDLSEVHRQNIIHRDVALENIIVASNKVHTLIDYGLATFVSPENVVEYLPERDFRGLFTINWDELARRQFGKGYTPEEKGFGRPSCVAPEVASGEKGLPASDVFSLGIVFWEALMRETVFSYETFATRAMFRTKSTDQLLKRLESHSQLGAKEKKYATEAIANSVIREPEKRDLTAIVRAAEVLLKMV